MNGFGKKASSKLIPYLGIDIGTTYSSAAYIDPFNKKELVITVKLQSSNRNNNDDDDALGLLPSIVDYSSELLPRIGDSNSDKKEYTIQEFKLEIGKDQSYELPNGQNKLPEDVAIDLLKHMKLLVEKHLDIDDIESVCLSMPPARYIEGRVREDSNRTNVMGSIGLRAGFKQIQVIEEPVAALIDIDFVHKVLTQEEKKIMVIDYGGGTCDIVIVQTGYTRFFIQRSPAKPLGFGSARCGGKFIDEKIEAWIQEFRPDAIDFFGEKNLREKARLLKEQMSRFALKDGIENPSIVDGFNFSRCKINIQDKLSPVLLVRSCCLSHSSFPAGF